MTVKASFALAAGERSIHDAKRKRSFFSVSLRLCG